MITYGKVACTKQASVLTSARLALPAMCALVDTGRTPMMYSICRLQLVTSSSPSLTGSHAHCCRLVSVLSLPCAEQLRRQANAQYS